MKLFRCNILNGYSLQYNLNICKIHSKNNEFNCYFDTFDVAPLRTKAIILVLCHYHQYL